VIIYVHESLFQGNHQRAAQFRCIGFRHGGSSALDIAGPDIELEVSLTCSKYDKAERCWII
jgi:hypothetical protein